MSIRTGWHVKSIETPNAMETLTTPNERIKPRPASPAMEAIENNSNAPLPPASFHLIMEPGAARSSSREPNYLEVPDGVSYLRADRAGPLHLETVPPDSSQDVVILEPVTHEGRFRLLLVDPARSTVLVNDQNSTLATLIKERDIIRVGCDTAFEVAIYWRPCIGKTPAELIGATCPICRTSLSENSRCYRCPCGKGMHLEEGDEEEVLKCALTTPVCQTCQRPVMLAAGYSTVPEFHHND